MTAKKLSQLLYAEGIDFVDVAEDTDLTDAEVSLNESMHVQLTSGRHLNLVIETEEGTFEFNPAPNFEALVIMIKEQRT